MQFNELLKTQMMLQMPSTKNPLMNMLALNGFEIVTTIRDGLLIPDRHAMTRWRLPQLGK